MFDRSPNVKPNLVLLITSAIAILRFDTETSVVTTLKFNFWSGFLSAGLVYANNHLIVTSSSESEIPGRHAMIYSIDLSTQVVAQIAGSPTKSGFADGSPAHAQFASFGGSVVIEREHVCMSATAVESDAFHSQHSTLSGWENRPQPHRRINSTHTRTGTGSGECAFDMRGAGVKTRSGTQIKKR